MKQKQIKKPDTGPVKPAGKAKPKEKVTIDLDAEDSKAAELLKNLTAAKKVEKKGHWETDCCGVRQWVED